jgi:hypothetical protein
MNALLKPLFPLPHLDIIGDCYCIGDSSLPKFIFTMLKIFDEILIEYKFRLDLEFF